MPKPTHHEHYLRNTCIELNINFEKPSFGEELRMLEEGFGSVMQSVGNGIRAVIKYILDTLRKFWGWLQGIWAKFRGNVKKKEKELDEREEECSEKIEEKIKHEFDKEAAKLFNRGN